MGQDGGDDGESGILTDEQRRLLEEKIKKDEMKLAADLFGSDVGGNILDIELNTETDFMNYAQVVSTKLRNPKNRRFLVSFFSTLLEISSDDMQAKELDDINGKVNVLFNKKTKDEKE